MNDANWGDVVLRAEQLHWLRTGAWGAMSVLAGTALVAASFAPAARSAPLLRRLGIHLAWPGGAILLWAVASYALAVPRGVVETARIERLTWLELGLFLGATATGLVILRLGWRYARPAGLAGVGVAIAVHGAALTLLQLLLLPAVSR